MPGVDALDLFPHHEILDELKRLTPQRKHTFVLGHQDDRVVVIEDAALDWQVGF